MGLPYARAAMDDDGRYHVICPVCGEKVYPAKGAEATKGALRAYQQHFKEAKHPNG